MSTSVPTKMRALVQGEKGTAPSVKEHPVPTLGANDVLVKVHYVAQNPTDWKHSAMFTQPGQLLGCDFSGHVVSLGSSPANTNLKVGDYVAGCVHGGLHNDEGSFAEYVKAQSDLVTILDKEWESKGGDAAQLGIAWWTPLQTMIQKQGNSWPGEGQVKESPWYLVSGASSSVGLYAVQLARIMGYRPLAICSPRNFDLVKSYGAEEALDYKDSNIVEKIKEVTGGGVSIAYDTISEESTVKIALGGFKEGGGRLDLLLPVQEEWKKLAAEKGVKIDASLMYTLHGKDAYFGKNMWTFEATEEDRKFGVEVNQRTPELLKKFGIKPNPTEQLGGLEAIPGGFEDQKNGKVSAKKLVYKISA